MGQEHPCAVLLIKNVLNDVRLYSVKHWGTQIKVCQGCRQKIECKPGEMAVAHYEEATFKIEGKPVTELTNCHYHLDLDCIMIKWPNYDGSLWATEWELEEQEINCVKKRGFNIVKSN